MKRQKILKAVPCQRAENLFDVGLKSIYFYKKKNLEKLFTGPGAKYFDFDTLEISSYDTLWAFELYQNVCHGRHFWGDSCR